MIGTPGSGPASPGCTVHRPCARVFKGRREVDAVANLKHPRPGRKGLGRPASVGRSNVLDLHLPTVGRGGGLKDPPQQAMAWLSATAVLCPRNWRFPLQAVRQRRAPVSGRRPPTGWEEGRLRPEGAFLAADREVGPRQKARGPKDRRHGRQSQHCQRSPFRGLDSFLNMQYSLGQGALDRPTHCPATCRGQVRM